MHKHIICVVVDEDYEELSQVLTFEIGAINLSVPLGVLGDNINEELEFFSALLSSPNRGDVDSPASVAIVDNNGKQMCNISLVCIVPC